MVRDFFLRCGTARSKRGAAMAQTVAAGREHQSGATQGRSIFGFAWRQSRRHQPWLCLLAGLIFPLTMVPLELQRRIIDRAIGSENLDLLVWLGGIYLAVVFLQGGLKYLLRLYRGMVSERTVLSLRRAVQSEGDSGDEGETVSIVASEVERVGGFVGEALSEPVLQGGILLAILGYMLVVEPTIALVSLAFFVPQILLMPIIQQFVNRRARRKVKLVRELGDHIVEGAADQDYAGTAKQVYAVRMSYYRFKFAGKLINNFMNHLAPLSVLMVGGYLVINGATTIGTVVAFISGFERMADPSRQLLAYYRLTAETQMQYRLIAQQLRG
jgi:ABC-type bacteriocin/lantibiotic exporter with double-glycine peptidase domain